MHGRPKHVFERGGGGDLAAEFVKIGGALRRNAHGLDLHLETGRQIADDDRDQQEEDDGQEVVAAEAGEIIIGLGEEDVVGEEAEHACEDRRAAAEIDRDQDDRRHEDERDVRQGQHE